MTANVIGEVAESLVHDALDRAETGRVSGEANRFFSVASDGGTDIVRFDLRPRHILVTHSRHYWYRVRGVYHSDRDIRQSRIELGTPEWERAADLLESLRLPEARGDAHGS